MPNLSASINVYIKPVYQRKKIGQVLTQKEKKPAIVSNQCPVYKFQCDLCDADYVGYTTQRVHNTSANTNTRQSGSTAHRKARANEVCGLRTNKMK